ncbi:MAG: hypothetical protein HQ548_03695, partial [Chloroflexi bacterium]|nr:hypothetical protein [Chloroflexota bacterium]
EPLKIGAGARSLPDRPGLGIELDMDYLKANPSDGGGAWADASRTFGTGQG